MWGSLEEGDLLEGRAPGRLDSTDLGLMVLVGMLGFQKSRGPAVTPSEVWWANLPRFTVRLGDSQMALTSGVCRDGGHTVELLQRWPVWTVLGLYQQAVEGK